MRGVILKKRGDNYCNERVIKALKFSYTTASGEDKLYQDGKWFNTGQKEADNCQIDRVIYFPEPFSATSLTLYIDKEHSTSPHYHGRFDVLLTQIEEADKDAKIASMEKELAELKLRMSQISGH